MNEPRTIYCDACGKHVTTNLVHGFYVVRTEARITALEAQRDRLRRFVRAQFHYDAENSVDNDFRLSQATIAELDAAWRDVSRHGDLGDEA